MRMLLVIVAAIFYQGTALAADNPSVIMNTSMGLIEIELDAEKAPVTVANFLSYVDKGDYEGTIFHRVIPGFMIQGGGHYPDMSEATVRETIHNEADNGLKNLTGTIAMARTNIIDSAGRQFFINVSDNDNLDHRPDSCTREDEATQIAAYERGLNRPATCRSFGYAVFGRVVKGMDVVKAIERVSTGFNMGHQDVPVDAVLINSLSRVPAEQ